MTPLNSSKTANVPTLLIVPCGADIRIGESCQMVATVDGSAQQNVRWSVSMQTGASITSTGLLSIAEGAPLSGQVQINATLMTDSSVAAQTMLPVWPALPQLSRANPSTVSPGVSTSMTLNGSGLASVASLTVNGVSTGFKVISDSQLQITASTKPWTSGVLQIAAQSGGAQGGPSNVLDVAVQSMAVSYDAAVRFVQQAGFGANPALVAQVQAMGFNAWLDAQLATPAYDYTSCGTCQGQWYRNTQSGPAILRQKVALALVQIFVTSSSSACDGSTCGPLWESMIQNDAFGDAQTLLKDVALSPIMGNYLNNSRNFASNTGGFPNQNFAREFMQLMSIGTVMLNQDGSAVLDAQGVPVPTYTQSNIGEVARALSGWISPGPNGYFSLNTALQPMIPLSIWATGWHDMGSKNILPNVYLPAGQSIYQDLDSVVNALFQHQNMGPFFAKRLIQHLVKSNPSPAYISRVARVFADDGKGSRGMLGAVVKAVLLDPEARAGDDGKELSATDGHYQEPILYLASIMNTVNVTYTDEEVREVDAAMGEPHYFPPSVFSYYSPDHTLADGTPAPETELMDGTHEVAKIASLYNILHNVEGGFWMQWNLSPFWNSSSPADLVDAMNHLLFHGLMSVEIQNGLLSYIAANPTQSLNALLPDLVLIAVSTSDYQVIR